VGDSLPPVYLNRYTRSVTIIKDLRDATGLTQAELADRAGTSQPTIAAYESGTKSPTLRTLRRLAGAVGRELVVSFVPAMTREDRRSLALHRAIAPRLEAEPDAVLALAGRNLRLMQERHPGARSLLDEWEEILQRPIDHIVGVMTDPGMHARDLRQVTPFAGVLGPAERARVYAAFARDEGVV
jgi:transcriptional regulator with XRE-family HTH domain